MSSPKRSFVVSLIGTPNVGKSSLFNRLMRKAQSAMTYDAAGTTRDRHYGLARFEEEGDLPVTEYILVDTGGFYPQSAFELEKSQSQIESGGHGSDPRSQNFKSFFSIMTDHAKVAMQESDLVLFVVDVREGITPFDQGIAQSIRRSKKPFWVLANKHDSPKQDGLAEEFYALGIDESELFSVSAAHNLGINDLSSRLHKFIVDYNQDKAPQLSAGVTPREEVIARVSIIGAPNAGKSTLLNHLLGAERALVSSIPGTTMDPIEGFFDLYFGPEATALSNALAHPHNNHMLFREYEAFRLNNPEVYKNLTEAYELEQVSYKGGDETVAIDLLLDGEAGGESEESEPESEMDSEPLEFLDESEESLGSQDFDESEGSEDSGESDESLASLVAEKPAETPAGPTGSHWRSVHLIDTAGIREQSKIKEELESLSVYRSLKCITESDVVILMMDAVKGLTHQDRRLIDIALEKGRSVILVANKIDLVEFKDEKARKSWLEDLKADLPWTDLTDVVPISAKWGTAVNRLKDVLKKTIWVRHKRVSTGELNRALHEMVEKTSFLAQVKKGVRFKIKYGSQVKSDPPTFLIFANKALGVPAHYRRYLQNGLRERFNLYNTPVHLVVRTGQDLVHRMRRVVKEGPDEARK